MRPGRVLDTTVAPSSSPPQHRRRKRRSHVLRFRYVHRTPVWEPGRPLCDHAIALRRFASRRQHRCQHRDRRGDRNRQASIRRSHPRESPRAKGPFIAVDADATSPDLLEIELFGIEPLASTGAPSRRAGAFEAANGGTLFLDGIGELSLDLQSKVLRVLERRQCKRAFGQGHVDTDVRVIAATHRNLKAEIAAHRFRSDLYYALAVVEVTLPPLRERLADLPVLIDEILLRLGLLGTPQADALRTPEFVGRLATYPWPGNVRHLRNYIERCVALGELSSPPWPETVAPPPLHGLREPAERAVDTTVPLRQAREECASAFERRYLEAILTRHANNVRAAARAAGVNRTHFYRLLSKHGIRAQEGTSERLSAERTAPRRAQT